MRQRDDTAVLLDMFLMARRVRDRVTGLSRGDFDDDENLQLALAYLIQGIGEAASRTSDGLRASHAEIPWHDMIGMRHRIVHDYMRVSADVLWATALDDVPSSIALLEPLVITAESEESQ